MPRHRPDGRTGPAVYLLRRLFLRFRFNELTASDATECLGFHHDDVACWLSMRPAFEGLRVCRMQMRTYEFREFIGAPNKLPDAAFRPKPPSVDLGYNGH